MMRTILAVAVGVGIGWSAVTASAQQCDSCDGMQRCSVCCDDRGLLDAADALLGRIHARAQCNLRRSQRDIQQLTELLRKLPGMQRRYQHGCGCDACDAGCGACDAGGNIGHARSPAVETHGNRAFHTPPSNTRRIGDGSESANSPPSLVRRRGIDTAPVFPLEREPSNGRNPNNSAAHQSADRIEERSPSASANSFVGTETPVDAGPADRPMEQAAEGGDAPTWRTRGRSDSIPSGRPAAIPQRHAEPIPDHLQNPFEDDVPAEGPGRPMETLPGGGPQSPFSEAFDPQAQEGSSHTATSSADTKSLAATHSSRRSAARRGIPTISTGHQVMPASAVAERFPPEPLPLRPVRALGTDRTVER